MDYLWRGYTIRNKYELDSSLQHSAPPIEVSLRKDNAVLINPISRFFHIFRPLLGRQDLWNIKEKTVQELSNCLLHFLAQLDRICGVSVALIEEDNLKRELLNGNFGESVKKGFSEISSERQKIVIEILQRQDKENGRILYFGDAVKAVFPRSCVYFYNLDEVFLVYLQIKENKKDKECMQLLENLFLDVTAKIQIYWEYPFGIIEQMPTMRMNHMKLYGT